MRVSSDLWPGYFPGFVAEQTGIYDSLGVDVQFELPENTGRVLTSFAARQVDVIVASIADVLPVLDRMPDLRILMCTDESAGADAVVARRGITTPAQLRGRRLGVKLGGFSELFVRQILQQAGVDAADVEFVDLDASAVPESLRTGFIDAGQTWEPYLSSLRKEGFPVVKSSRDTPGLIVQCVFTHVDVLRTHEPQLQRFIEGWFLGQQRFLADTAAGLEAVATLLGRSTAELNLSGVQLLTREENRRRFAGVDGHPLRRTIDQQQEFFGRLGLLRAPIDATRLIDGRFVQ